ncbi:MAG: hypothetical protein ACJAZE_001045, partial [Halioglobus sp.]
AVSTRLLRRGIRGEFSERVILVSILSVNCIGSVRLTDNNEQKYPYVKITALRIRFKPIVVSGKLNYADRIVLLNTALLQPAQPSILY